MPGARKQRLVDRNGTPPILRPGSPGDGAASGSIRRYWPVILAGDTACGAAEMPG
ncbi:MAG: hypothetical protein GKS00_01915 [Alphaproteobacteria bacterium]|nr:hypothetical protein [Alphaproteobacteria bacterium]